MVWGSLCNCTKKLCVLLYIFLKTEQCKSESPYIQVNMVTYEMSYLTIPHSLKHAWEQSTHMQFTLHAHGITQRLADGNCSSCYFAVTVNKTLC